MHAAHDFFAEQPVRDAAVFFLKAIVHDWADSYAEKILRRLRDAALPTTRLVTFDKVLPYACRHDSAEEAALAVPGVVKETVPDVLPANFGGANLTPYFGDINVSVASSLL